MRRILTAFALLAASCTPGAVSSDDAGTALTASASTCNQSICDTVCVNGKAMKATLTAYLACFHFLNCSCSGNPNPPPNPPPAPSYGGSTATGGATSTGGSVSGGTGASGGGSTGTLSRCQRACANLSALGCPESQATCPAQCELASTDDRFTFNVDCRINAKTKAQAQACGTASCK